MTLDRESGACRFANATPVSDVAGRVEWPGASGCRSRFHRYHIASSNGEDSVPVPHSTSSGADTQV